MEGTRKTISKMIKTPHLTETPRHSYKTHGPWLSYVAAYKASAWNAGVFSKFEIPMKYPEISGKKSVKLPQITKSHTIKFYKSHLITSHRKTHGKCKATEVFKWKFLTLWTFSDKCAAVYIYIMTYTMYNIVIATHATLQHLPCPALLSKFRCQGTGHDRLLGRNNHGHGKGNQVYGD